MVLIVIFWILWILAVLSLFTSYGVIPSLGILLFLIGILGFKALGNPLAS